jgi:hypothetical protein
MIMVANVFIFEGNFHNKYIFFFFLMFKISREL